MRPVYYMIKKDLKPEDLKNPPRWQDIKALMSNNFVKSIIELKTSDIPDNIKKHILKTYLKIPAWKVEDITRASAAAGALASWAESQLSFADILTTVKPL